MSCLALGRLHGLAIAAVLLAASVRPADAFIEELFGMGGGGGMFQMGGGRQPRKPKWPKNVPQQISKHMAWLKGTEWHWNNWRNVKFHKDGNFEAPTDDCDYQMCTWAASEGKIYILWGDAGMHRLEPTPKEPADITNLQGMKMRGVRISDGQKCHAGFQRIFDHEAAELEKDLYAVLGLTDDASEVDIKKIYRKLSVKYHPDKNPDAESRKIFNDVRDAYEILNDPDKKILYDTGGMESVKKFEKGEVEKGDDVDHKVTVGLDTLYNSGTVEANIERQVVCRGCRARPDSPKCKGCRRCPNEVRMVKRQVGPGFYVQEQQEIHSKEMCKREKTPLTVTVERGTADGEVLSFPRMAEESPGKLPGAMRFTVHTVEDDAHPFTRKGDDLHMTVKLELEEALLGWDLEFKHLDGHVVTVKTTSVTRPYQIVQVKGEGMPLRDDPASFGSLYVKCEVVYPTVLTEEQRKLFKAAFDATPKML